MILFWVNHLQLDQINNNIPILSKSHIVSWSKINRLYDLLVKHFTNTIMDNAVGVSSSANSSLSYIIFSTLPLSNQCDMDRKVEESESFHQSRGDIFWLI